MSDIVIINYWSELGEGVGETDGEELIHSAPFPIGYTLVPWDFISPEFLGRDCMNPLRSSVSA